MADFPGANATRDEADYVIVGAPLDVSTTFRPGARFGPDQIRTFARPFDDYDRRTDQHFSGLVADSGDVTAWDDAAEYLDFLEGQLTDHCDIGQLPLVLGGEHTVTVAAVRATDPDIYVALDAHLDLYEAYAGNEFSHATVTTHALETADRAVLIGARTGSETEWDRAAEANVTVVPPEDVPEWSPSFDSEDGSTSPSVASSGSLAWEVADSLADISSLSASTGSFALSDNKLGSFIRSLEAYLEVIAEQFNRVAIRRIYEMNGWDLEDKCELVHEPIGQDSIDDLGKYLDNIKNFITPDQALENALRKRADLPEKDSDNQYIDVPTTTHQALSQRIGMTASASSTENPDEVLEEALKAAIEGTYEGEA